jgi:hypothetical protein
MTDPSAIDRLLAQARSNLERVPVEELADEVAQGAILIDIRPLEQRRRDGDLPDAIVIDRNVLEWRLDPSSPHRLPIATGADVPGCSTPAVAWAALPPNLSARSSSTADSFGTSRACRDGSNRSTSAWA